MFGSFDVRAICSCVAIILGFSLSARYAPVAQAADGVRNDPNAFTFGLQEGFLFSNPTGSTSYTFANSPGNSKSIWGHSLDWTDSVKSRYGSLSCEGHASGNKVTVRYRGSLEIPSNQKLETASFGYHDRVYIHPPTRANKVHCRMTLSGNVTYSASCTNGGRGAVDIKIGAGPTYSISAKHRDQGQSSVTYSDSWAKPKDREEKATEEGTERQAPKFTEEFERELPLRGFESNPPKFPVQTYPEGIGASDQVGFIEAGLEELVIKGLADRGACSVTFDLTVETLVSANGAPLLTGKEGKPLTIFISGFREDESSNNPPVEYYRTKNASELGEVTQTYTWQEAAAVKKLIASQDRSRKINIVGHSMGAVTAAHVTAECGRKIDLVITVDPEESLPLSAAEVNEKIKKEIEGLRANAKRWVNVRAGKGLVRKFSVWDFMPKGIADDFLNRDKLEHKEFSQLMKSIEEGKSAHQILVDACKS